VNGTAASCFAERTADVSGWVLHERGFDPGRERFYESLFFLGNGRFGFRGFRSEGTASPSWERTTFTAGFFGELKPGKTDMVNCPDILYTELHTDGTRLQAHSGTLKPVERKLYLRTGTLCSESLHSAHDGARLVVRSLRFASLADRRFATERFEFEALDRDMMIELTVGIDGTVKNSPIHDDQLKKDRDFVSLRTTTRSAVHQDGILIFGARSAGTGIALELALTVIVPDDAVRTGLVEYPSLEKISDLPECPAVRYSFMVRKGERKIVDRIAAIVSSRDPFGTSVLGREPDVSDFSSFLTTEAEADALSAAVVLSVKEAAGRGVEALLADHKAAWDHVWRTTDVEILGNERLTLGLRFSVFQLVQNAAPDDSGVSIGARGLSHGRYKGCYFWDTDVFMLPFFAFTQPDTAQRLLDYRHRTLPGARTNAREQGVAGARYAWMCTLDGREQCDTWDIGLSELHITADIAWAVCACRTWLKNEDWFFSHGLEILIETARYWRSRFIFEAENHRWNLLWVKGPDEYCGVTVNNAFTVIMARENLRQAALAVSDCKEKRPELWAALSKRLHFDTAELGAWEEVANGCVIPYDGERSLYLEDELFLKKEFFDLCAAKKGTQPLYRTVPFDKLQRLRVLKQADLVLLGRLLPGLLTPKEERAVWDYYEPITAHDSTLSFGPHAEAAARLGLAEKAAAYLEKAVRLDLDDLMDNVADEGLHLAASGGAWRAAVFGLAGFHFTDAGPALDPILPAGCVGLRFSFTHHGTSYRADVNGASWTVRDGSGTIVSSGSMKTLEASV
jgi:kojibiose phosphorylase